VLKFQYSHLYREYPSNTVKYNRPLVCINMCCISEAHAVVYLLLFCEEDTDWITVQRW